MCASKCMFLLPDEILILLVSQKLYQYHTKATLVSISVVSFKPPCSQGAASQSTALKKEWWVCSDKLYAEHRLFRLFLPLFHTGPFFQPGSPVSPELFSVWRVRWGQLSTFTSVFNLSILFLFSTQYNFTESQNNRITESQNSRGWKGPLWVI